MIRSESLVFFPDPPENLYQLRQWYGALAELDKYGGVTVITQDSRTARAVREETDFEVLIVARNRTFAGLVDRGNAKIAIYVGHANNNMVGLRSTGVAHIFLAHGDSDKSVSVSNQVKGFDFTFVAGPAAIERYAAEVLFFDAARHLRVIGRPQLPERVSRDEARVVLYAPTWEGSQETNAYSSVISHGEAIVRSLLASGFSVLYRPHPRLGVSDRRYREADQAVRALVTAAGEHGEVDTSADQTDAMQRADVLVTDISAMSSDWLSQRKPLLVTVPVTPQAVPAGPSRLHMTVPRIDATQAVGTGELVRQTIADPTHLNDIEELAHHYLGGLNAAEATEAFVRTCREVAQERDRERAVKQSGHASP
ncbi:CDP-glycerol glycerophosphotransferase family protein [Demequina sp. NBRC 110055]|uniref:CDP-glycerol glycerophosphotransferase family protein n=1 Tax=Demequina sp. NBRC 110055 TaxID=1570344 RepID=UPI0013566F3C|nr:CDP-glycerol glycerophosphotransferase family protein [Demequina sp. NBRC 110055]